VTEESDRYFDIEALARYAGLSTKSIQRYIDDPVNPLPSHHVHGSGRERGRVLIAKREFDAWVTQFPPKAKMAKASLDARVTAAVRSIRGEG
jgi:hypothetical protein